MKTKTEEPNQSPEDADYAHEDSPFGEIESSEKPNQFELAANDYVTNVSHLRDKLDYEIAQAFLAGVQYGLKVAQDQIWDRK